MTYEETLQYLYAQLPMFSRVGAAAYKKDIHNTVALCDALGNPQQHFKSIHIAGTNGKGSTSHMLAAIFQQQGYKTGLYTSPHIKDFGERIRINGQMIDPDFVVNFTEKTKELFRSIKPSFFELTVAMAFAYFAEQKVDIAIIETGLGGRLDSTNVLQPILSVITNIGMDHTNLLGNTIAAIATEKAGIIKKNTPVVIGETTPETKSIFSHTAATNSATIYYSEELFEVKLVDHSHQLLECIIAEHASQETIKIISDLTGEYQLKNIRTVITALSVLKNMGWDISTHNICQALSNIQKMTGIAGRWQILSNQPKIILDVAHNKDGINMIVEQLHQEYRDAQIHFVLGFVNDKEIDPILALLPKDAQYYFTNAHINRALPHDHLKQKAATFQLKGNSYDDVNDAIEIAKSRANPDDIIMVCGSFFILSEIK